MSRNPSSIPTDRLRRAGDPPMQPGTNNVSRRRFRYHAAVKRTSRLRSASVPRRLLLPGLALTVFLTVGLVPFAVFEKARRQVGRSARFEDAWLSRTHGLCISFCITDSELSRGIWRLLPWPPDVEYEK